MCAKVDLPIGLENNDGFSLVELIVVIAILLILLSIAIPNIVGYVETARQSVCDHNRVQFEKHYILYLEKSAKDHSENIFGQFILEYEESYGKICPSNGIISYENGVMKCEMDFGEELNDEEEEEVPYI